MKHDDRIAELIESGEIPLTPLQPSGHSPSSLSRNNAHTPSPRPPGQSNQPSPARSHAVRDCGKLMRRQRGGVSSKNAFAGAFISAFRFCLQSGPRVPEPHSCSNELCTKSAIVVSFFVWFFSSCRRAL